MRGWLKAVVILGVFVGVGFATGYAVVAHAGHASAARPEVRLAGAMAGLFVGGLAAVVTTIVLLWKRAPEE